MLLLQHAIPWVESKVSHMARCCKLGLALCSRREPTDGPATPHCLLYVPRDRLLSPPRLKLQRLPRLSSEADPLSHASDSTRVVGVE
jgi:hypothetical protein